MTETIGATAGTSGAGGHSRSGLTIERVHTPP